MKNKMVFSLMLTMPDGQRAQYDLALAPHELFCMEPLPEGCDESPAAAVAAATQLEARGRLARNLGDQAAQMALDIIEHANSGEPVRGDVMQTITRMRADPRYARVHQRFGAGRY
jgi:hypothetical protein